MNGRSTRSPLPLKTFTAYIQVRHGVVSVDDLARSYLRVRNCGRTRYEFKRLSNCLQPLTYLSMHMQVTIMILLLRCQARASLYPERK